MIDVLVHCSSEESAALGRELFHAGDNAGRQLTAGSPTQQLPLAARHCAAGCCAAGHAGSSTAAGSAGSNWVATSNSSSGSFGLLRRQLAAAPDEVGRCRPCARMARQLPASNDGACQSMGDAKHLLEEAERGHCCRQAWRSGQCCSQEPSGRAVAICGVENTRAASRLSPRWLQLWPV